MVDPKSDTIMKDYNVLEGLYLNLVELESQQKSWNLYWQYRGLV